MKSTSRNGAVLIATTDPMRNPNYGGILQAWALCEALKKLNYEPWIYDKRSTKIWRAWYAFVRLGCRIAPRRLTLRWWHSWPENQPILRFARSQLQYTASTERTPHTDARASQPFVGYLTGSDQVWRPEMYPNVEQMFLGFVPTNFSGPRIAYAASFGRDDPSMFTELLLAQTTRLTRELTAVSVREESGVVMVKHLWGLDAQRVCDPVFLVSADEYRERFEIPAEQPILVTYILDPSDRAESVRSELMRHSEELGIGEVLDLAPRGRNVVKPTVEEWIRAIGSAKYVLTDSFHGTAFSILFGRRFITFPNESRGSTRLDTLFGIYGYQGEANSSTTQLQSALERDSSQIAKAERDAGMGYLRTALGLRPRLSESR